MEFWFLLSFISVLFIGYFKLDIKGYLNVGDILLLSVLFILFPLAIIMRLVCFILYLIEDIRNDDRFKVKFIKKDKK